MKRSRLGAVILGWLAAVFTSTTVVLAGLLVGEIATSPTRWSFSAFLGIIPMGGIIFAAGFLVVALTSLLPCVILLTLAVVPPTHANVVDIGGVLTTYILLVQTKAASEDDAARRVREQTGGRVLGVETASKGGGNVYLVKVLLPSGTVRVVEVGGQ